MRNPSDNEPLKKAEKIASTADWPKKGRILLSGPGEPDSEPPEIDGYEIIKPLGEGGMAVVWRAKQLSTSRQVALKVMSQSILRSKGKAKVRFEREVTIAAGLEHPNIARIYESGIHEKHYFYAMELIHGKPLDKYVASQKLSVRETLQLMHKVCQSVQYAHQHGIIHRDLKHSNIMVTPDGQPHVLDFGLARDLLANDRDRKVSLDGDIMGTPAFMSPEQAAGDIDAVDTRSDVYSLGIILYNLLTSDWPYDVTGRTYEVLKIIQENEPVRPSCVVRRLDRDIEAILLQSLAKSPNERYRSAGEFADDIQRWLQNLPVTARSVDTWYILRKYYARHQASCTVAISVLVILICSCFISTYFYLHANKANTQLRDAVNMHTKGEQEKLAWAHQLLFELFLELWHRGETAGAQVYSQGLPKQSKEDVGAQFLLDRRILNEKERDYEVRLAQHPTFWMLLLGEHHLKNGDEDRAITAYTRCIENEPASSEFGHWHCGRARRIIAELRGKQDGLQPNQRTLREEN